MHLFCLLCRSDVVRFHPTDPHLLAVSSLGGALSVLNVNLKRTMYCNAKAHKSYSAEIAWLPSSPSTLLSVGGTTMKVFDTRQNVTLSITNHNYSYSTLAISPCEKYCCVGDVKGAILSYDLRNVRTAVETNNCHDGIVTNLQFLPGPLESELSTDDNQLEEDSDVDPIDKKKSKRRNSAQIFFDMIAPVKPVEPVEVKKPTRRDSAQDFFDVVAPQRRERSSSGDEVFTKRLSDRNRSSTNDLKAVPEENATSSSSNSNQQMSLDNADEEDEEDIVPPSSSYLKNKRHTIASLTGRSFLGVDNVFNSPIDKCSTPHDRPIFKPAKYDEPDMNQLEDRLHEMEVRMNEKLSTMQRKFDEKLSERTEELSEAIVHGFRSIHCAFWAVAESDIKDTRNMVATIHENYSQIADVFIENLRLREQVLQLQQQQRESAANGVNNANDDVPMDPNDV